MCDLDVYTYLYLSDLAEFRVASSITLQVSDFIMVPVTKNVERGTESRSPQNSETESESEDDMGLRPASLGAIPASYNTGETSPTEDPNLRAGFDSAIPSQGSSPHVDNATDRALSVLESPIKSNPPFSMSFPQTVEQADEIELQLEQRLAILRKRKEILKNSAANPRLSNPLQCSGTAGDEVARGEDDKVIKSVIVELKMTPGTVIKSGVLCDRAETTDAEEDSLEFTLDDGTASGHEQVGSDQAGLLEGRGPQEPVVSLTGEQPKHVDARGVFPEELLLSLSTSKPGRSISVDAEGGERDKSIDPYDTERSPAGDGGTNISLHHEALEGKRSRGQANKADDSDLPHAKRPHTRSQIAQGATGEERGVESTRGKLKVILSDDDGDI